MWTIRCTAMLVVVVAAPAVTTDPALLHYNLSNQLRPYHYRIVVF